MRIKNPLVFCTVILLLAFGCSGSKKQYRVGVDPSWFPLDLEKKELNVLGFVDDMLQQMTKEGSVAYEKVPLSWDDLIFSLNSDKCDAIFSSMQPMVSNEKKYSFSDIMLETGPVLVVAKSSRVNSLSDLSNASVAVEAHSRSSNLLDRYPDLIPQNYTSIPSALDRVVDGTYQAAIVPRVLAVNYINDLYKSELKIAGRPILQEGIRLVTLKNAHPRLIKSFNKSLKQMKRSGEYQHLVAKWGVN
ncbi:MAG: transporter substrate-binding domain-containing protein [Simkaniaceae bacterium]|nr:transporter substrate-binding domain-containing protein [Simkaniaceae bacterium]